MPTFEVWVRFWAEFERLSAAQQVLFLRARDAFVEDLRAGIHPRSSLRVKRIVTYPGVWELSWAPDGRTRLRPLMGWYTGVMEPQVETLVIGKGGAVCLPARLMAKAHLAEGSVVVVSVGEDGRIAIFPEEHDPDQAWFWTEEWQKGEREADEALKVGRFTRYMSEEEFDRAIESRIRQP